MTSVIWSQTLRVKHNKRQCCVAAELKIQVLLSLKVTCFLWSIMSEVGILCINFLFKVMISVPFLTLKWSNFIKICDFDDIFTRQPWSLVWVQLRINLILLNLISNILLQFLVLLCACIYKWKSCTFFIGFLAHLAKGHVSFCHHLASVVRRKL